nr:hypothetical protein CFP56_72035 [Quercus suber]
MALAPPCLAGWLVGRQHLKFWNAAPTDPCHVTVYIATGATPLLLFQRDTVDSHRTQQFQSILQTLSRPTTTSLTRPHTNDAKSVTTTHRLYPENMADDYDYPDFSSAFSYAAAPTPSYQSPCPPLHQQRSSSSLRGHRPRSVSTPFHSLRHPFAHQRGKSYEPSMNIQFRSHHDNTAARPSKPRFTLQAITSGTIARRRASSRAGAED